AEGVWQLVLLGRRGRELESLYYLDLTMPALRLKAKLVIAITAMVVAIVATLAAVYISELVSQRIQEAYNSALFVRQQVFAVARGALEVDLSSTNVDLNNPTQVAAAIQEVLETDTELNALLDAAVGNSPTTYDAAIIDAHGVALLHTNAALF